MAGEATYLPVSSDDADRQQSMAKWFWLAGDILAGADGMPRYDPQTTHDVGVLGPVPSGQDIGVGQDGVAYLRGRSITLGATQSAPDAAGGMLSNPLVLVGLVVLAVWALPKLLK